MLSRRCPELQTELIDLFLPELSQLYTNGAINFNNTKQLDSLVRHLELTTSASAFNAVPSTTILHILFTISVRALSLNWSHDSNALELLVTSEYMKQVNKTYDNALYKDLLPKRAHSVLQRYLELISEEDNAATSLLYERMHEVILTFVKSPNNIRHFFRNSKSECSDQVKETVIALMPSILTVEVVSDSEESDAIVDADESEIISGVHEISKPNFTRSFTDLGNNTTGLGQSAVLFKDMPHLLTQVTPDPFDNDDHKTKRQRRLPTLENILIFDDVLLFKKLQDDTNYNIWNLIRWTFWCCDLNSQYQQYLFNSSQTRLHEINQSYQSTLDIIVHFCGLIDTKRFTISPKSRLFGALGPRASMFDRGIEFIFTGLGIPTNDFPAPYYSREKILILSDPVVQVSQCKDLIEFDDNKSSMKLRIHLLELLCLMANGDAKELLQVSALLAEKLVLLSDKYIWAFFDCIIAKKKIPEEHGTLRDSGAFRKVLFSAATNLIGMYSAQKLSDVDENTVLDTVIEGNFYLSIIRDSNLFQFSAFYKRWESVLFLVKWTISMNLNLANLKLNAKQLHKKLSITLQEIAANLQISSAPSSDESDIVEEEFFTPSPMAHNEVPIDDSLEEVEFVMSDRDKEKTIEKFKELVIFPLTFYA